MKWILISLIFIILTSCTEDENDNCYGTDISYVISTDCPKTGKVNEVIDIPVEFAVYNGCGGFGKFVEQKSGNTIEIEVLAVYEGCICPLNVPVLTENYQFYTNTSGTYYLKFKSSPVGYIIDTLHIY